VRFLKTYAGGARGWIGAPLLALAVSAIALAGGAATGHAASSPSLSLDAFTVLNDKGADNNGTDLFYPTAGGNIGYEIRITNIGTSVANHFSLTETISSAGDPLGALKYVNPAVPPSDSTQPSPVPLACNAPGSSVSTLSCTVTKLDVGAYVDVIVLFKTDPSLKVGAHVTDTAVVAFDSQTNGQSNHKTTTYSSPTRDIAGLNDGSLTQSIFLPTDDLPAAGAGQTSEIAMPGGNFVNGFPYVSGSLQNETATPLPCNHCPALETVITIPKASSFTQTGPFYDGTTDGQQPFTWTLTLKQIPNGYKFTGVYHNGTLILSCADPSGPLTLNGICVSSVAQTKQQIKVIGLAFTNGTYQFG
jgi:hypothetical protein